MPAHSINATCMDSTCGFECDPRYRDCDGVSENGCETDVTSSRSHCGACGRACAGGASCVDGTCVTVQQISGGGDYGCALLSSGVVRCWSGWFAAQNVPRLMAGAVEIATSRTYSNGSSLARFSCARMTGGSVLCWGTNSWGLGDGSTTGSLTPVTVAGLGNQAAQLALGARHACVLLTDGSVRCWGFNDDGALGDGTVVSRSTPVEVIMLGGRATQITASNSHSCALLENGTVRCWGFNGNGELGDGTTSNRRQATTVVMLDAGPLEVRAGEAYTCARFASRQIRCWGGNSNGQFADGTSIRSNVPVVASNVSGAPLELALSRYHACARFGDDRIRCWGAAWNGQLGTGLMSTSLETSPVVVVGLDAVIRQVASNEISTCALLADNSVRCWGDTRLLPTPIPSVLP